MVAKKRTRSMELAAIRQKMNESPPPPPAGTSVREWFAGLALASNELMKDIDPSMRAAEAVRLADELADALVVARLPDPSSTAAPTEEEMTAWETSVANAKEGTARRARDTVPQGLRAIRKDALLPPALPLTDEQTTTRYAMVARREHPAEKESVE